jgi:hypothetical protein
MISLSSRQHSTSLLLLCLLFIFLLELNELCTALYPFLCELN